ncbi:MAG: sulfurtransferase-like selenium metabolism protein YedF [Bacteroidales bacterium]|nr:sulfurtransferase-like selenium metabolism protein YedF [Bacteroidales bacterium]
MQNLKNTLIQVSRNGMGAGDETLGIQLITNYLKLISEENDLPKFMVFYNAGVKLICEGSPVIDTLKVLEQKGVKLIACKTCLNYFNLMDKMEAGLAGTMMNILELQKLADKVIAL